ncbi:competence type IV pilus minor pilin ComGD [Domibacillus tundrae]|uniref:competence type IV pilus minor pilin ComGD n=1 Tax=Domibacillus tundrae TaxID=1587527 RepID=UPI000617FC6C|nr:competence type IV pilus minor pilin ComGD [Domibacillus tundrae]
MVHKENGFTLLEMMIVLTIFIVCLTAALIPLRTIANDVSDRQFFQQIERDLFAAQAYAIAKGTNVVVHFFENGRNNYHIYTFEQSRKTLIKREIPNRFIRDERNMSAITFLRTGMTNRFGIIYFTTEEKSTRLVFLIGRGRFYFLEE